MCGIIAISSRDNKSYPIRGLLNTIMHRGPDDHGVYVSRKNDCHLGQARLSIIDTSNAGHQPMVDASGRYVLSYNGEIYNYRELKDTISKTYGFRDWKSTTDTEIILEGFAKEGVNFFNKINGIFAIALYDKNEENLYILRDQLGIKPIFYSSQSGNHYFCSELKGLLDIPELKRTLREDSLSEQLGFMYIPEPNTLYNEFKKVKPGVCFVYNKGKCIDNKKIIYSDNNYPSCENHHDIIERFRHELFKAVDNQLVSDVPVSVFLSGGLDSSAIAHRAVNSKAKVENAFTISYSKGDMKHDMQGDDLFYARQMAKDLDIKLEVIEANSNFMSCLPKIIDYMEDGFSDPAAINTYLICEHARAQGIKVMLSGQGADEFLGGYRRYQAARYFKRIPSTLLRSINFFGKVLPTSLPGSFNAFNRRLKRFCELSGKDSMSRILEMYIWASPQRIKSLFNNQKVGNLSDQFFTLLSKHKNLEIENAMMALDHHYDLMSLNLCYTDRMSMASGVEVRVPFLDFNLVNFMNSLPLKMKIRGNMTKYILKKSMEGILPENIIYRSKTGFSLPIRSWLNKSNGLTDYYLDSNRIKKQGIYNVSKIEEIKNEQINGFRDNSYLLFTLLVQQILLEKHFIL